MNVAPHSHTTYQEPQRDYKKFVFGFDLRLNPRDDVRIYLPFLKYLSDTTGYEFTLKISDKYESNVEKLGNGQIHLAALGSVSAVIAMRRYNARCLVMGLNNNSKPEYRAVIFVSKQSTISKITQLKGGSFAFGDRLSTQGHLIPRKMLEDAGIYINDFKKYTYTGSHANTAKEVINGRYDAGAMQDNMAYRLQKEGKIKIIAVSKPYPSSLICCHKDLPPEVIDKIKNALLSFSPDGNHKERLYDWHKTEMPKGFTNVKEDSLKEIIYLSKRYTLLN